MELTNGGGNSSTSYGVDKLVGTNYKYWKMCMEAYLQGQDLWDLIVGPDDEISSDTPGNSEPRRKWKIKCGTALFALRTSISKEFIDHVRDVDSPKEVWETLERIFSKKNTTILQLLENELAQSTQGGMSISEYFLRVKSICAEISELDTEEKISDAKLRQFLIRGLKKEYIHFVTSIQGWAKQPSVEELESLLSNQEALAKQMSKSLDTEYALYSKGKYHKKNTSTWNKNNENRYGAVNTSDDGLQNKSSIKCYRCGKIGHIKRNCRVKLSKANVASDNERDQLKWEQCFTVEDVRVRDEKSTPTQVLLSHENCKEEWIIDSGCSHHVTGNDELLSDLRQHKGERVIITADNSAYPVAQEGVVKIGMDDTNVVKLNDVFHVPGLKRNLISVSQITDSGKFVLFGPKDVKVLKNVKNISADVVTSGEKRGSLFVMVAGEAYVKKTSQTESAAIWHARLGHLGYQLLQKISSKRLVDGMPSLRNAREVVICQGCQFGKSHRLPFMKSSNRKTSMLELIHTDLMGPTKIPSFSGYRYAMVLVDDFSRYTWIKFLKEKSEALTKFAEFRNVVEKEFGMKIKCIRNENGGEYMSDDFFQYCGDNGIARQMTCPDTPQQNEVSERKLAHFACMSLSWFHDKHLPREFWAETMQCACHVINRLPPWPGKEKSPLEFLYNMKPNVHYFRVFGSICYVHVPKSNITKLDPKAKKCIFVGYDPCRKGWRCMDPETKKFVISRDVFDEMSSYFPKTGRDDEQRSFIMLPENDIEVSNDDKLPTFDHSDVESDEQEIRRISTREKRQPQHLKDYEVRINSCSTTSCFFVEAIDEEEPTSYEEARVEPKWQAAMLEEIEALHKNQTWELVPKPENCEPITSFKRWKLWQLDVKNAFLYGDLDREVFMEQPKGYVSKQHPHHVCRLKKALYGLKQAPRAWYGKVAQYFVFCGFKVPDADSSLFVKLEPGSHLLILLYVDDMIITGDNKAEISKLKNDLSTRFEMKSLGEVGCFLGLEIKKSDDGYFISQETYAKKLLQRFGLGEAKEKATPMEPYLKLLKDEGKLIQDVTKFQKLVAMISWCSKKQNVVSLSSTEAEYVAATMAAQECIWLRSLMKDMFCKVEYDVQIKCDNEGVIKLASNSIFHARTKHIEVRHHYIREKVLSQEVELQVISTNNQVADIFTKALGKLMFEEFRAALGVVSCKHALRGSVKNISAS
ncbi:hypothetical protein GQ457_14G002100 [Hibiscus cannabinus]